MHSWANGFVGDCSIRLILSGARGGAGGEWLCKREEQGILQGGWGFEMFFGVLGSFRNYDGIKKNRNSPT